jgi:hypothetical protein
MTEGSGKAKPGRLVRGIPTGSAVQERRPRGRSQKAFSRTKEQRDQSNKLSELEWDCAHELDRGVSEQAITVCEELDNPDDAEMRATEAANLKPATPEPHEQMLSIYTRAGRADLAKAEQELRPRLSCCNCAF